MSGIADISISESEQITGSISGFGCLLVVITYLTFKEIRNLRYIELVFYVAVNMLFASVGIALGATRNESECWFQDIATNGNYLSAIFWTTVITFQVWLVVHYKVVLRDTDMYKLHIFCWGVPLVVTLLPLSTNTFGGTDDGNAWCFISSRADSPSYGVILWELLSFYSWLWMALLLNVFFLISIGVHLKRMAVVSFDIAVTLQKLMLYPIILIVCWIGSTIFDMYGLFHQWDNSSPTNSSLNKAVTCMSILQGILLSTAFFVTNGNVRKLWVDLLYCRRKTTNEALNGRTNSATGDVALNGNSSSNNNNNSRAARISQISCTWGEDVIDLDENGERTQSSIFEFADRNFSSVDYSIEEGHAIVQENRENKENYNRQQNNSSAVAVANDVNRNASSNVSSSGNVTKAGTETRNPLVSEQP